MSDFLPLGMLPARPRFLGKTIENLVSLADAAGVAVHPDHRASHRSFEQQPLITLAPIIWDLSHDLYGAALKLGYNNRHPDPTWDWVSHHLKERQPEVGSFVWIHDAFGKTRQQGVGFLTAVTLLPRTPQQNKRYPYKEDGGPYVRSRQYHLRLLDGTDILWGNCSPKPICDHYLYEIWKR